MQGPPAQPPSDSPSAADEHLVCAACGEVHRRIPLAAGEKAWCHRCATPLAKGTRYGLDTALASAVTGLILAIPAASLPLVRVSKLTNERIGVLFTGPHTLWEGGMRLLAIWVVVCGALMPLLLLSTLVAILLPGRTGSPARLSRSLIAAARAFQHWAMPEVQVLAVLVALVKLHTLVNVQVGTGFWCYVAMSLMMLFAWRSFDLESPPHAHPAGIL